MVFRTPVTAFWRFLWNFVCDCEAASYKERYLLMDGVAASGQEEYLNSRAQASPHTDSHQMRGQSCGRSLLQTQAGKS